MPGSRADPARVPRQRPRSGGLRAGHRHRRCLVRSAARPTPSCWSSAPDLKWPASLYLEGSDQHRGWFHSSLLEACGTRGRAPYDAVLTHGFVLDEQGRKMSKSLGNVVAPQDVVQQSGADILRLWVVGSDYSEDLRIGPEILKHQTDVYRRLRNTLRYLWARSTASRRPRRSATEAMPELERWVLHRLAELDALVRRAVAAFDFHAMFTALHNFCAVDLSAFYFDVRKDPLYCDAPGRPAPARGAHRARPSFDCLVRWLAPVLCFTAEEAWLARHGDAPERSVHLELFAEVPQRWRDPALGERWAALRDLRRVVTGAHRARARRKAARLEPAGRGRNFRARAPGRAARTGSIWPSCASLRPARSALGPAPDRRLHLARRAPISACACRRRRARDASAAGGCCPRSGRCRATPICAAAAPRSVDAARTAAGAAELGERAGDDGSRARRRPSSSRSSIS